MESKRIRWERQKLYEEVWSKPLRVLAKEFGLSDVGLAKICKKMNIPTPGLGYWTRVRCGQTIERTPLPIMKESIELVTQVAAAPPQNSPEPLPPLKKPVPKAALHPLVQQTKQAYVTGRVDDYGRVLPSDWNLPRLSIRVTKPGLQRALEFMDRLIKLIEANDMRVSIERGDQGSSATRVTVDHQQIEISLKEEVQKHRRPAKPATGKDADQWVSRFLDNLEPSCEKTTRLVLEFGTFSDGPARWADGKRKKIEDQLESIVHGLLIAAAYQKRRRAEREEERRREEEERRLRWKHEQRVERLTKNMELWEKAQRVRAYAAAVRECVEARDGSIQPESLAARFLSWTQRYADSLDPTVGLQFSPDRGE
jgi:hypothetical protein